MTPSKNRPKVTVHQAVPLLMEKFGYVVVCFPQPQQWPFNGDAVIGCCINDYMGARVQGKLFEVTERSTWDELEATAQYLKVNNPIPKTESATFFRAVLINENSTKHVGVLRRSA